MPKKRTTADINAAIAGRPIQRVGYYINYDTKIEWKCLVCDHYWHATPNNVISKCSGCPECGIKVSAKKKIRGRQQTVLEELKVRNIELLSPYTRVKDVHKLLCGECNHEWSTTLNCVVNSGSGCPQCAGNLGLTNHSVDQRLLEDSERGIVRVGNIINAITNIEWKCGNGHSWMASPDKVLNMGTGCRICAWNLGKGLTFKGLLATDPEAKHIPTILYVIRFVGNGKRFVKVGVTTQTVPKRFKQTEYKPYTMTIIHSQVSPLEEAIKLEQKVLDYLQDYRIDLTGIKFGGHTECFHDVPEMHEIIKQHIPY